MLVDSFSDGGADGEAITRRVVVRYCSGRRTN